MSAFDMDALSLLWQGSAALTLAGMTLRVLGNMRFSRWASSQRVSRAPWPRVSVLVPARDEAATITACVSSLLGQGYPNVEVIVLDDASTDTTAVELDRLAARYPQLRVIHSTEVPPTGWNGKSYACARLAALATGDWLLFTDADTCHTPVSVSAGVELACGLDAAMVSAFPWQDTQTGAERLLVSFLVDFMPLVLSDFRALWQRRGSAIAANGQYLLVRREAYRAIGGHAAIAEALVDDFALAARFQQEGYAIVLITGASLLRCRMYHSVGEVVIGFSKNVLLGFESLASSGWARRWWQGPLFLWCYAAVFVLPVVSLARGKHTMIAAFLLAWLIFLRAMVAVHLKRAPAEALLTPVAAWSVMALSAWAIARRMLRRPVRWKGRCYP